MQHKQHRAVFLSGSLMRHVSVMSLTASVGILAIFAVDFVDMIFISMLGQAELAAAIGYAGTLLFFTNAINIGLSITAGSLVARSLGADKWQEAREYATSVALFAVLIAVIVPSVFLLNLEAMLRLIGARGETLQLAMRYCSFVLPTMCFMGLGMVGMAILRAHGNARASMYVTVAGSVVNAALDPVFIFGLGLGLDGAALASILARLTMLIYAKTLVMRLYRGFARPSVRVLLRDTPAVVALAAPAILTNLATPVGNAFVTRQMAEFGTEAVAAMAVIGRLTPLAFAVVLALSGAIGPIVGQNFGAGRFDRVRGALLAGLQFVVGYVLVTSLALFFLRDPIADLFEATGHMRGLIFLFCGPLALFQIFNGIIFVCNASFNNLGHPFYSTAVNWGRHTLGTWPFVLLGAYVAGAAGVLVGQALGGVLFAIAATILAWKLTGRLAHDEQETSQTAPPQSPEGEFEGEKRLHQVTTRRGW